MEISKIYLAGCGGMLGEAFYKKFKNDYTLKCTDIDTNEKWIEYLDFRDYENYKNDVENFEPDWIFHLGAFTDLEYCEVHEDDTYITNTESVKHAVKIANQFSIPLLFISTAGIFDGKKNVYDESDVPNPIGHYGISKFKGEQHVINNSNDYLICRAGWMMGGGPQKDKKFINKIMKQIKEGKKELFIVDDKFGTPTYTHDFAKNTKVLIENNNFGLYNMACEGNTSRLEVAEEILNILNLKNSVKLIKVDSSYFKEIYFAKRPNSENLINKKLNDMGLNLMRPWRETLKEYLEEFYCNY